MDQGQLMVAAIPPSMVPILWDRVAVLLESVLLVNHGEATLEGIHRRLLEGNEQLVGVFEHQTLIAMAILGVSEFETGKRCLEVPYVAGERMADWLGPGFRAIEGIAREMGCSHIRGCGRPGWERAAPGFRKIRTVYEREVSL